MTIFSQSNLQITSQYQTSIILTQSFYSNGPISEALCEISPADNKNIYCMLSVLKFYSLGMNPHGTNNMSTNA